VDEGWSESSRTTVIRETDLVRVRAYRNRGRTFGRPLPAAAPWHSVLFVRSGHFEKRVGGREVVADPNWAIFFNRGEEYDILAPSPYDDRVTELEVRPSALAELVTENGDGTPDPMCRPFPTASCLIDPSLYHLHLLLWRAARDPWPVDALAIEETALRLVDAAVRSSSMTTQQRSAKHCRRPETARAHADLAHDAMSVLGGIYRERPGLDRIATTLGVSAFHLCRVFKSETGLSIHRYVDRLRLREAMVRVLESKDDLSRLALQLGFASHSHLTASFRREFGLTPSQTRRAAGSGAGSLPGGNRG
jgi:AraC-like DNA-binding protein